LGIHHPFRFLSLALCNTSPRIANEEVWEKRTLLVREKGLGPIKESSPSRWFTPQFKEAEKNKVNKALEGFNHTDPEDYISCCKILKATDLWKSLSMIKSRTLIVAGRYDEVTTVAEAQGMKEIIPGSRLEVLSAAHLSNIEAPGFSQLLRDFMIGV
jgi:3-oxoadipate enol-lactonase